MILLLDFDCLVVISGGKLLSPLIQILYASTVIFDS